MLSQPQSHSTKLPRFVVDFDDPSDFDEATTLVAEPELPTGLYTFPATKGSSIIPVALETTPRSAQPTLPSAHASKRFCISRAGVFTSVVFAVATVVVTLAALRDFSRPLTRSYPLTQHASQTANRAVVATPGAPPNDTKTLDDRSREVPFDHFTASKVLDVLAIESQRCATPDVPSHRGSVSVTFGPTGRAIGAVASGKHLTGSPFGQCVIRTFRRAIVPSFHGSPTTVHRHINFLGGAEDLPASDTTIAQP